MSFVTNILPLRDHFILDLVKINHIDIADKLTWQYSIHLLVFFILQSCALSSKCMECNLLNFELDKNIFSLFILWREEAKKLYNDFIGPKFFLFVSRKTISRRRRNCSKEEGENFSLSWQEVIISVCLYNPPLA